MKMVFSHSFLLFQGSVWHSFWLFGICLSLILAFFDVRDLFFSHSGGLGCWGSVCHSFWRFLMSGFFFNSFWRFGISGIFLFGMWGICLSLNLVVWDVRDLSLTHSGGFWCQVSVLHSFWRFGMWGIYLSVNHSGGLGCRGSVCHSFWRFLMSEICLSVILAV